MPAPISNADDDVLPALAKAGGLVDEYDSLAASIYKKQLEIEALQEQLAALTSKRDMLLKQLKKDYGLVLREPNIKKMKAILDEEAKKPPKVTEMIRRILRERFDEDGVQTTELINEIQLRWGRFKQIRENTIRVALSRMSSGETPEIWESEAGWVIESKRDSQNPKDYERGRPRLNAKKTVI